MDVIVRQKLDEARWRLTVCQFLTDSAWALLAGCSLLLAARVLSLFVPVSLPLSIVVAVVPLFVAIAAAVIRWRSLAAVAGEVDARAVTRDRFVTALKLGAEGSLSALAQKEISAFVAAFSPREHLRFRVPARNLLLLLIPLLAIVGVEAFRHYRSARLAPELAKAEQVLEETRKLAKKNADEDKEFEKTVKDLDKAIERLQVSSDPMRDALRAMADLEQKLASSASAQSALEPEDVAALAEALASQNPQAASDLRSGDNEAASEKIADMDAAAVAKALQEAAKHRENSRLQELSQQGSAQARAKLSAMLKSSGGAEGSDSSRRKFISQMNDLKNGQGQGQQSDAGKDQSGESGENSQGDQKTAGADADNAPPEGSPGSEKDKGQGAELAGEGKPEDQQANDDFIQGTQGDGASLVEIFRASGSDDPKARQAYRNAYQTALPSALDAVNQEEIPAGSRILVRRYFESIRPKE